MPPNRAVFFATNCTNYTNLSCNTFSGNSWRSWQNILKIKLQLYGNLLYGFVLYVGIEAGK